MKGYVYIITDETDAHLHVGLTSNLPVRIYRHRNRLSEESKQYSTSIKLLHWDEMATMALGLLRQKEIEGWEDSWVRELVMYYNPELIDRYEELIAIDDTNGESEERHPSGLPMSALDIC